MVYPECNQEIRNRIRIAVAAYAYEVLSDPIMSDAEFDKLAQQINPQSNTGDIEHDLFFRNYFESHTGSWVYLHPNVNGLHSLYEKYYSKIPNQ